MKTLYSTEATVKGGGRNGQARTSDGRLEVELDIPRELGGEGGNGTNPEQLFAAGYAACFASAVAKVGRTTKREASDATVTSRVGIGSDGSPGYSLWVEIRVDLPSLSQDEAESLVAEAHETCPYSRATRDNIPVHLIVEGEQSGMS